MKLVIFNFIILRTMKIRKPSKSSPPSMYMSDPILSPDDKWMWTGAEWIPAPPVPTQPNDVSIQETAIMSENEAQIESSIDFRKNIFAYVSIVFVILIAVYLLMNSSPEDEVNNGSDIHLQGFDTQGQIPAKVTLLSTVIENMGAGTESLFSTFELAAGSKSVLSNDISFNITCDDNNYSEGTFLGATIHTGDGAGVAAITLNPGTTYVVSISVVECAPAVNADNVMVISVTDGGDTSKLLQYGSSPAVGDVVV